MSNILDFLFPPICGICGNLNKNFICKKCELKLKQYSLFRIDDYSKKMRYFSKHLYVFKYDGELRKVFLNYKFNDKPYIYKTFVNFLKKNEKMYMQIKKYDIIVPVPISKKRYKTRGYNQSALISSFIAKDLNIKYEPNCLIKIKNNVAQSSLDEIQREENVKNAYKLNKTKNIKYKNILLVDDIFTTGNTVNECSKILRQADIRNVDVFTLAKD